eukprot:5082969-Amphidinium_carterae.1
MELHLFKKGKTSESVSPGIPQNTPKHKFSFQPSALYIQFSALLPRAGNGFGSDRGSYEYASARSMQNHSM